MVFVVLLLYQLVDILLVLFLGIIVAAALQPLHVKLCDHGVPRGVAVLLIYVSLLVALLSIGLLIVPPFVEQLTTFATSLPDKYAGAVDALRASPEPALRMIGRRLPPFGALTGLLGDVLPSLSQGVVGVTTGVLTALAYVIAVLAVGFYWTMEVPRFERLIVSFVPVARRVEVLNIWHEIERKLGAFIRGQSLTMLIVGALSAVGYFTIGLPHVLALGVLAGLFEVVPLMGPILAAVPAIMVALPLGADRALMVVGWSLVLQGIESYVLTPRIMGHTMGMSSLVGLLAVLAFGTLYGVMGVFIAIPLVAAITVILDRAVINLEPAPTETPSTAGALEGFRNRVEMVQQQVRRRFRGRPSRVGIDPETPDHVVDAIDLQLEKAAERVKAMIAVTERVATSADGPVEAAILADLEDAIALIEEATERVDTVDTSAATSEEPDAAAASSAELEGATKHLEKTVDRLHTVVASTQDAADAEKPVKSAPTAARPR